MLLLVGAARAEPFADALWQKAAARTEETAWRLDGVMGVGVRDLTDGRTYALRGQESFPVASVIKIAVLAALYREVDARRLDLGERVAITRARQLGDEGLLSQLGDGTTTMTLGDLAAAMIVLSENSATNVLIDRVGIDRVNATLQTLGLRRTALRRRMLDLPAARAGRENTSTPEELLRLLEHLYRGRVLSPASTEAALRLLRVPDKPGSLIPRGVAPGVPVLGKPGELDGVRCECAIVEVPRRPFALCVLTTFLKEQEAGKAAIVEVTRTWYDLFQRLAQGSPSGRLLAP